MVLRKEVPGECYDKGHNLPLYTQNCALNQNNYFLRNTVVQSCSRSGSSAGSCCSEAQSSSRCYPAEQSIGRCCPAHRRQCYPQRRASRDAVPHFTGQCCPQRRASGDAVPHITKQCCPAVQPRTATQRGRDGSKGSFFCSPGVGRLPSAL